jgi:septal ring factor EnvC (AmiA/AmiB activator)
VPALHRPTRRWPYVTSIVVLCLAAASLGTGFAYSNNSAQEWRTSANKSAGDLAAMTKQRDGLKIQTQELQTRLDDTQNQLTDTRNQLADTQKQLDDMTTQFNTATDRVRSVSNEKAQVGDDAALMATLFDMSQDVTQGMDTCIDDLQKLQTYLVDFASYDSDALISYAGAINSGCNQARAASDELSKKLAG